MFFLYSFKESLFKNFDLDTKIRIIKNINSKKIIFVNPIDIQSNKSGGEKIMLIKNFMAENYSNPDLSFYDLQKATKLSAKEIREINKVKKKPFRAIAFS